MSTQAWMETGADVKLYARFEPISKRVEELLGLDLALVPTQSPTEIEEYGHHQLIVAFTPTSIRVTVEGGIVDDYIVWWERELDRSQAHRLIEGVGSCWYDEWEVPL